MGKYDACDRTASDIAKIIEGDDRLKKAVLEEVNSDFYGFRNRIDDLRQACVILGFHKLNQIYTNIRREESL